MMSSEWLIICVVIILVLAITIFAIRGEFVDYSKYKNRNKFAELKRKEREEEYIFNICFPYDHLVKWRTIFLGSLVATFLIFLFFYGLGVPITNSIIYLIIFAAIFITFYGIFTFERHHFWRDACSKVREIPKF